MRIRTLPLLLLSTLVAIPALADDVYLVNGRKFEGVIAETVGSQVRIQMQGGVISLPDSQVLRIDAVESNFAEYLRRRAGLQKSPGARASDWLELARWAHAKGLEQAARESALAAAALDPKLEGLPAMLRGYGYVLDAQVDRWVPYAEFMKRRGFVLANGQWITRDEYQAKLRDIEEEQARRRALQQEKARAAREDRLTALTELSLVRELARPSRPAVVYPEVYATPVYPYYPVVVVPGYWGPFNNSKPQRRDPSVFNHVPGSLLGGALFPESN